LLLPGKWARKALQNYGQSEVAGNKARNTSSRYSAKTESVLLKTLLMMITRFWQILRDDSTKTFEVCGQVANDNAFTNRTYAMQRAGMNVSCMTPPVTNKSSSKGLIKITGYTQEDGLQKRLEKQFNDITTRGYEDW
jgi:hypothetical protein